MQKETFYALRKSLSGYPVLHNPDFSHPFILATDASGIGVGTIHSQGMAEGPRPVLFISQKLSPAETKYATVEKEALARKWAVDIRQYYLMHNPFLLVVDHGPLKWMGTTKEHNTQILQWYLSLLPFSFTVRH